MKTYFLIFFLTSLSILCLGQNIEIIALEVGKTQSNDNLRTASIQQTGDTLSIPFIDDFTTGNGKANTDLWEDGSGVVINNTSPIDQPNVNVGVLDGLDETGTAYRFINNLQGSSESIGTGDDLFSKPINLSSFDISDSIALSFFYQLGALDEVLFPDINSLYILKVFFKNSSGLYDLVWPTENDEDNLTNIQHGDPYELAFIKIEDSKYLHDGFQMRFQVFGHTSSNVDTWTLDNIVLDSNRTSANYSDVGLSLAPDKVLKNYNSIPIKHFLQSPNTYLKDETKTTVKNISIEDNLSLSPGTITLTDTISGTVLETLGSNPPSSLTPGQNADLTYTLDKAQIETNLLALTQDRFYLVNTFSITGPINDSVLTQNDIVSRTTVIDQHYAYDDGSAEYAAGVGNSGRSFVQIALKYETYQPDTLTQIFVHFPKYGLDLSSSSINIKVWKSLEGVDGANEDDILYNFPFPITYVDTLVSGFHSYELTTPIILEAGDFYIGYEHSVDSRIFVGVDASSNSMDQVYTNVKFTGWKQDFLQDNIEGNLMIRPKFGFKKDLIQAFNESPITNTNKLSAINIYPNPANHTLNLSTPVESVTISTIDGQKIYSQQGNINKIDTQEIAVGFYILTLEHKGQSSSKKFVIQH